MGGNANCKSRKSTKGGPHEVTESDTGYHELYMVRNFFKIDPCSCRKSIIQCGPPRSAPVVRSQIAEQVRLARYGISKPIETLQTATGIKDKIAQHWIEILLAKAREMKKASPGRSNEDIARDLETWFIAQPGDKINPLLLVEGSIFQDR